jgi:hypothetical protein
MAVALDVLSVVIPIKIIDKCRGLGGFRGFLQSREFPGHGAAWYDEFLFREGAMNPMDLEFILAGWKDRGLKATGRKHGNIYWKDLCVVDFFDGPTLPCDWIEVNIEEHCAWLKGTPKGAIRGST